MRCSSPTMMMEAEWGTTAHCHLPRHRPRALEGRLRAAQLPPQGRPLWREPQPPAALLPGTRWCSSPHPANILELYLGSLEALGFDLKKTTSASSRTTGRTPRWAPGAWAGRSGSTAWKVDAVHLLPAGVAASTASLATGEITYGLERLATYSAGRGQRLQPDVHRQA